MDEQILWQARSCSTCRHSRFKREDVWLTGHPQRGVCMRNTTENPPEVTIPSILVGKLPEPSDARWELTRAGEEVAAGIIIKPPTKHEFAVRCVSYAQSRELDTTSNGDKNWWRQRELELVTAAADYYDKIMENFSWWQSQTSLIIHRYTCCADYEPKEVAGVHTLTKKARFVQDRWRDENSS